MRTLAAALSSTSDTLKGGTVITSMHHTGFVVADLDKSVAFYRDVMGLTVNVSRERKGGPVTQVLGYEDTHLKIALLSIGDGHTLELIQYVHPTGAARPTD